MENLERGNVGLRVPSPAVKMSLRTLHHDSHMERVAGPALPAE